MLLILMRWSITQALDYLKAALHYFKERLALNLEVAQALILSLVGQKDFWWLSIHNNARMIAIAFPSF